MKIAVTYLLSCIFVLLFVSSIHGSCKRDVYDEDDIESFHNATLHHLRDAQRLFTYTPKSASPASASNTLKFMTFNMQSGFLTTCVSGVPSQAAFIQSEKPDYLASEEVVVGVSSRCNCNMAQEIADAGGLRSTYGMTLPYGTGMYGTNTATSQTVLDTRYQLLTYSGVEQRMVVAVRTQPVALKGRFLWFATCHVDYGNAAARYSQIGQIIQFLQNIMSSYPQDVVVTGGDFNGGPWDQGYSMFTAAGFHDAWQTYANSIDGGNTIPAEYPGSRFDHIWYKLPAGVTVTVPSAVVPDVRLSDHRPFWANLAFSVSGSSAPNPTSAAAPPVAASGSIICAGPIYSGTTLNLACPAGMKMNTVQFANWGTPSGTCQSFVKGSCIGGSSVAVFNDKCIGRSSCSFVVSDNVFGNPCPSLTRNLRVQILCK